MKKFNILSYQKNVNLFTANGHVSWCSHYEKSVYRFLKKLNTELPYDLPYSLWVYTQKRIKFGL
jgi:hypothetical protein